MNKYFDFRCRHCCVDIIDTHDMYMVRDEIWKQISRNNKDRLLCFDCAEYQHGKKFKPEDLKTPIWLNQDPIQLPKRPAALKALLLEKYGEPTQIDFIEERVCRALGRLNRKLRKSDTDLLHSMLAFSNYNLACEEDGYSKRTIASLLLDWLHKYGVK